MSLSLILTCYHEVPLIFESYERIIKLLSEANIAHEIIIVDDGSGALVQEQLTLFFKGKQNTILLLSSINEGRGASIAKGIKASSKDYVGFIDTDLEISEHSILSLYQNIQEKYLDIVIGYRIYTLQGDFHSWVRFISSRLYGFLSNRVLKLNSLDTETGIKIFKRDKIIQVIDQVEDKKWFWDTEIIAISLGKNFKIAQYPVFVNRKKDKKSSVKFLRDTFRYLYALYKYRQKQKNILGAT